MARVFDYWVELAIPLTMAMTHDGYDWNISFGLAFLNCITIPLIFFSLLSKHRTKEDYVINANMAYISTIRIFSSAI